MVGDIVWDKLYSRLFREKEEPLFTIGDFIYYILEWVTHAISSLK